MVKALPLPHKGEPTGPLDGGLLRLRRPQDYACYVGRVRNAQFFKLEIRGMSSARGGPVIRVRRRSTNRCPRMPVSPRGFHASPSPAACRSSARAPSWKRDPRGQGDVATVRPWAWPAHCPVCLLLYRAPKTRLASPSLSSLILLQNRRPYT